MTTVLENSRIKDQQTYKTINYTKLEQDDRCFRRKLEEIIWGKNCIQTFTKYGSAYEENENTATAISSESRRESIRTGL